MVQESRHGKTFEWIAISASRVRLQFVVSSLNEETIWDVRKKLGMVFQNPDNQFVGTTVQDDVAFGLENHGFQEKKWSKGRRFVKESQNG